MVDGEVGRFQFSTHSVIENDIEFKTAMAIFPPLQTNEYYKTAGFKEISMIYGDTEKSYRRTTTLINRIRYQQEHGTSFRTLQDNTEKEGLRLNEHIAEKSRQILENNEFTEDGVYLGNNQSYNDNSKVITTDCETVKNAAKDIESSHDINEMLQNPVIYEDRQHTVNITIDDVNVKKQEESRDKFNGDKERKRKFVHNTVIHVENDKQTYILNGHGMKAVLRFLIAFLFNNDLVGKRFQFFTDGHTTLNNTILKSFNWYSNIGIILDWYHLQKKCKEQLSMAMKGKVVRNTILEQLMPLLWHGLTQQGIDLLRETSQDLVKNKTVLEKLIAYLERNTPYIPCYAIRKELNLCNSSAIGEKMNDLVVAERQKHNGMSWSKNGSVAVASITSLKKNKEFEKWFEEKDIEFKLAA